MCIICYIPKGAPLPSRDIFRYMARVNGDGMGIAWNNGKAARMVKGYNNPDTVYNLIRAIKSDDTTGDIVFHARIATSGGISPQKCHPYPVAGDVATLNATDYGTYDAPLVFHNGVFPLSVENGLNDTQTFVKSSIYPLYKHDADGLKGGVYDTLLRLATSYSRLLLLYPDGVKTFGTWEEDGGIYYSNRNYAPYAPKYYNYYTRNNYTHGWDADFLTEEI